MTAEAEQGFRPLDEASLVAYIKATPALASRLGGGGSVEIKEVGDGNLNFVYIVKSSSGAIVVKQVRLLTSPQLTIAAPDPVSPRLAPDGLGAGEMERRRSRTCAAWGTRGP